jgi:hypothetical protein
VFDIKTSFLISCPTLENVSHGTCLVSPHI